MGPWSDTGLLPASHHLSRKLPALPNRTPGVLFSATVADGAFAPARVGAIPPKHRHAIAKVESEFQPTSARAQSGLATECWELWQGITPAKVTAVRSCGLPPWGLHRA